MEEGKKSSNSNGKEGGDGKECSQIELKTLINLQAA